MNDFLWAELLHVSPGARFYKSSSESGLHEGDVDVTVVLDAKECLRTSNVVASSINFALSIVSSSGCVALR